MSQKKSVFRLFTKNDKGQSVLEYVILTGLIGIFCMMGVKQFGKRMKTRIDQMNKKIEQNVRIF